MSEAASISAGIAERYASALFELANDNGEVDALERDADALHTALYDSDDLRRMVQSPLFSRKSQQDAITGVAQKMELSQLTARTLGLMASKRRLFVLPHLVRELQRMIADHKGEVTAEVTAAQALSDDQRNRLAETLKAKIGSEIKIKSTVDERLIGGLVVKVGSRMIDTSIAAKLANLQHAMKEVR